MYYATIRRSNKELVFTLLKAASHIEHRLDHVCCYDALAPQGDSPMKGLGAGSLPPTRSIGDDGEQLRVGSVDLQLIMAPGETPDHMVIWHSRKKDTIQRR